MNDGFQDFRPKEGVIDNNYASDRVLVLKVIDGLKAKSSLGVVDPRLFNGENNLHLVMNTENSLWGFKYDRGNIPGALNQQFTSVERALQCATTYLKDRNIEIIEVIE